MGAQLHSTQKKGQKWVVRPIFDNFDQKCQNPRKWAQLPIFEYETINMEKYFSNFFSQNF